MSMFTASVKFSTEDHKATLQFFFLYKSRVLKCKMEIVVMDVRVRKISAVARDQAKFSINP